MTITSLCIVYSPFSAKGPDELHQQLQTGQITRKKTESGIMHRFEKNLNLRLSENLSVTNSQTYLVTNHFSGHNTALYR